MLDVTRYIFRTISKYLSSRIDAIPSIPNLRAYMAGGSGQRRLPRGLSANTIDADGLLLEWIIPSKSPAQPVILYLHGGGWTLGWYNGHRRMTAYICQAAGCRALAVDYRLAPESPFPCALDDCVKAYRWLLQSGVAPNQIVIAGDSAGGNLTLATLMSLRAAGDPLPAAAVCISPLTDLAFTGDSFNSRKDALLSARFAQTMARHYAGSLDPRLPLISPHYGDLSGLPPMLIHVGGDEILLSDAVRLAEHARAAAVDVRLVIWPGMWHVWHTFVPYLPQAQQAVNAIGAFVREHTAVTGVLVA